ncbi:MAG TPA: LURP-one-related family protein [Polyangia bacterium]|nr:LURP-one-related family protein [Polyangia bacterium]
MRYLLRQKMFALGDDFTIRDADGNEVFFVDGKAFTIGDKLSFQDPRGHELAFIKEKVLAWGATYELWRQGQLFAVVKKKKFTLFHCQFFIDVPGPDDLTAQGNFSDHEYTFRRREEEVAHVSKRWFTLTDTYGVDIAEGEDPVLILASTVVIDLCCHPDDGGVTANF